VKRDESKPEHPTPTGQKPHEPPRLIEYGSITKLTQGSATVGSDAAAGFKNMACL
jgi:hypothetical protein